MRQWVVDAFASGAFRGNAAAVVEPLDDWPLDAWMQALARENNQSETAFLRRTPDPARFGLRWFTPTTEVPLCGHATLASGHVLIEELGNDADQIIFETRSGELTVTGAGGYRYEMNFPADPPYKTETPDGLAEALGVEPLEVWAAAYLVAIVRDEAAVRGLTPDLVKLAKISGEATGGPGNVSVVALADKEAAYDVVSRFFAPGSGIPEDPATGSAHCILAPLFSERLERAHLRFHQAYPGRGGDIATQVIGPRVILAGRAVTVAESRLRIRD
jgi:PhzF family phenazine biosynthesis protein